LLLIIVGFALHRTLFDAAPSGIAEGAKSVPYEIRARNFILVDANGESRAALSVSKYGPRLCLRDNKNKDRVIIGVIKDGPWLSLHDENGEDRAALSVHNQGPVLCLSDEDGGARAVLWVRGRMYDGREFYKDGPALTLSNEAGDAKLQVGQYGPVLDLCGEHGRERAGLGVYKDGPWMELRDADGKTIRSTP